MSAADVGRRLLGASVQKNLGEVRIITDISRRSNFAFPRQYHFHEG